MSRDDVFSRLNDKAQYTGVYAERFKSGGGINSHDGSPSTAIRSYKGSTNTNTDTTVHDISQIMRPNLRGDSLLREKKAQSLTGVKATTRSALRLAQEKAKSKVVGDKATSLSVDDMQSGLENVYRYYCTFGKSAAGSGQSLPNNNFAKFARETPGLVTKSASSGPGVVTMTDIDLVFTKSKKKGERKLGFTEFQDALEMISVRKFPHEEPNAAIGRLLAEHVLLNPASRVSGRVHSPAASLAAPPPAPHAAAGGASGGAPQDASSRIGSSPAAPPPPPSTAAGVAPPSTVDETQQAIETVFSFYCSYGGSAGGSGRDLTNANFAKFCRETPGLLNKSFTTIDADLTFTKAKKKGERRLNFSSFLDALELVALKKYPGVDPQTAIGTLLANHVLRNVNAHKTKEPSRTAASSGGSDVFSRLNDKATYTGVYAERFASGDGRINSHTGVSSSSSPGAAKFKGSTNTGTDETIRDISTIMRPEMQAGRFMHF